MKKELPIWYHRWITYILVLQKLGNLAIACKLQHCMHTIFVCEMKKGSKRVLQINILDVTKQRNSSWLWDICVLACGHDVYVLVFNLLCNVLEL